MQAVFCSSFDSLLMHVSSGIHFAGQSLKRKDQGRASDIQGTEGKHKNSINVYVKSQNRDTQHVR